MIIIKLFFYIVSPFFLIIMILLYPLAKFRFCFLSAERIGEITYQIEKYFLFNSKKTKKKYIDIFFVGEIISNKYYLNLLKKKITIHRGFIFFPLYKIIVFLSCNFKFFSQFLFNKEKKIKDLQNTKITFNKLNLETRLSLEDQTQGESYLKKLGIKENDKIALLYVRDSHYLKSKFKNKDYSYHDFRDCNIDNFYPAINALIEKGYYVFRMGEISNKDLKFKHKKFIDYTNQDRSEYLDIFLSSRCSFVISCGGGFGSIPSIVFRKPILYLNGVPILPVILDFCNQSLFSIKLHYDNKEKRYLTFKEIIKAEASNCLTKECYEKKNLTLIENNKDDIKEIVLEFISNFEYNDLDSNSFNYEQKKTLNVFLNYLNLKFDEDYALVKPKISNAFIKKYDFLLND